MAANPRYDSTYIPRQGNNAGLLHLAMENPFEETLQKLEQLGQRAGVSIAQDNARQAVLSGENPGDKLPLSPAALAYNQAAHEAYAVRTEADLRAKTAAIASQFDGRRMTDPDSAAQLFDAHANELLGAIPDNMRGQIGLEIQARRAALIGGITERAQRFEFQRNDDTLQMGIKSDFEEAAAIARDGGPPEALGALYQRAYGRIDSRVQMGLISPEMAELRKADLREGIQAEALYGSAVRSGNLVGVLNEVETGGPAVEGFSLKVRDHLASRLQSELAQQNHALALQDHQVSLNTRDLAALNKKQELGVPLSADELGRRDAYLSNPAMVREDAFQEGAASKATFGIARQVATMTPQQIDATVAEWAMTPPASEAEALIRNSAVAAFNRRESALRDDPMSYAMTTLPDAFRPVVLPADVKDPAFDAGLAQLAKNAELLRAQYGVEASPLTKGQKAQVATALASMPAKEQAEALGKINLAFGDRAHLVYEDLSKQGAPSLAYAGWRAGDGDPDTAMAILHGQQAIAAGLPVTPLPVGRDLSSLYSAVNDPAMIEQLGAATDALYADRIVKGGKTPDYKALLSEIAPVGSYNGRAILLPRTLANNLDFGDRVASVTAEEIGRMAGRPAEDPWVQDVTTAIRDGQAVLMSAGNGHYAVDIGTGNLRLENGRPFLLNVLAIQPKTERPLSGLTWGETGTRVKREVASAVKGAGMSVVRGAGVGIDVLGEFVRDATAGRHNPSVTSTTKARVGT